jgi:hypothetical protein
MTVEKTWKESGLVIPLSELQSAAQEHAPRIPSILDRIPRNDSNRDAPYTLEEIEYAVFTSIFPQIASLANDLGYGWVAGVNSNSVGGDYVYVPRGTKVKGSGDYEIQGPAFAPNLIQGAVSPDAGAGEGYRSDLRTSVEFIDVRLVQNSCEGGAAIIEAIDTPTVITSFTVNNLVASEPTSTVFSVTVFTQSSIGISSERNWSKSMHWDVSGSVTLSAGGGYFPSASLTVSGGYGEVGSSGGSETTTNNLTEGTTKEISFSHSTPPGTRGEYEICASEKKITMPFNSNSELVFGIKIHGFLRWGGGQPFHGNTNYHNQYSGSGDRPTVDAIFGGGGTRFYESLQSNISENAAPWAWNAMFRELGWSRNNIEHLIATAKENCKFPASGVMMTLKRSNFEFKTIREEEPTAS